MSCSTVVWTDDWWLLCYARFALEIFYIESWAKFREAHVLHCKIKFRKLFISKADYSQWKLLLRKRLEREFQSKNFKCEMGLRWTVALAFTCSIVHSVWSTAISITCGILWCSVCVTLTVTGWLVSDNYYTCERWLAWCYHTWVVAGSWECVGYDRWNETFAGIIICLLKEGFVEVVC